MKKLLFILIALIIYSFEMRAITYTFTGAYNTDWSNALNWKGPAGKPGNVILRNQKVVIESACDISQGINIMNYGELVVTNSCLRFHFYSVRNYGRVSFEQASIQQGLGASFINHDGGILMISSNSKNNFCHLENKGSILDFDTYAKLENEQLTELGK